MKSSIEDYFNPVNLSRFKNEMSVRKQQHSKDSSIRCY